MKSPGHGSAAHGIRPVNFQAGPDDKNQADGANCPGESTPGGPGLRSPFYTAPSRNSSESRRTTATGGRVITGFSAVVALSSALVAVWSFLLAALGREPQRVLLAGLAVV